MNDRIMPNSQEAEVGVLGAMILDADRVVPVAQRAGVGPDSFYLPARTKICQAIYELSSAGVGIDLVTVEDKLRVSKMLDAVGGRLALEKLVLQTPTAEHAEFYLDIVRQTKVLRDIVHGSRETEGECYGTQSGDAVAAAACERFLAIAESGPKETVSNIEVMGQSLRAWQDAFEKKEPAIGLQLPWEKLTELLCGLELGMTIIAGRPSMGKTTLEDCICCFLGEQKIATGRVTLDASRKELLERAIARKAGVSLPKMKFGHSGDNQRAKAEEAAYILADYPMWINDRDRDIRTICAWARMMKRRHDIQLLTVDFAQLVRASEMGRSEWDRVARVTYVSERLKGLSFELGIPVVVLSQLNRVSAKEKRNPELSDLRDSGALEQDATKVMFVYRDEKRAQEMEEANPGATKHKRPMWCDVVKHKDGETGRIPFWMRPPYFRFDECDEQFSDYEAGDNDDGLMGGDQTTDGGGKRSQKAYYEAEGLDLEE